MAHYDFGPLGPFRGKLGHVVGSSWKGKPNLRSLPKKSTKPTSERKKKSQTALTFVSKWLAPINQLVMIGFDSYNPSITGRMSAHSYNATHALSSGPEGFSIDYNKAHFSIGDLPHAPDAKAELIDEETISITWNPVCLNGAEISDVLMYAIYFSANTTAETGIGGYCRREGSMLLKIPSQCRGLRMEVMIAFKSVTNTNVSTSQYLGSLLFNQPSSIQDAC
ncbi:DUF6266 family protein [Desertivirga brevis]|uniref:DUF6266 family protein n=1 Tax=Desertivirga brevis TaxID=2810310 RepID=UPI001A95FE66|nr:DUF6266 family protein [Pedobacter sp. SYSU D00873]